MRTMPRSSSLSSNNAALEYLPDAYRVHFFGAVCHSEAFNHRFKTAELRCENITQLVPM